jgi:hypothetical protein
VRARHRAALEAAGAIFIEENGERRPDPVSVFTRQDRAPIDCDGTKPIALALSYQMLLI